MVPVNLSLCTLRRHMGEWSRNSTLFLTSAISESEWWDSGSAALCSVKEPLFALHRRRVALKRRKIPYRWQYSNHDCSFLQPVSYFPYQRGYQGSSKLGLHWKRWKTLESEEGRVMGCGLSWVCSRNKISAVIIT
jgi:hypothetical protein